MNFLSRFMELEWEQWNEKNGHSTVLKFSRFRLNYSVSQKHPNSVENKAASCGAKCDHVCQAIEGMNAHEAFTISRAFPSCYNHIENENFYDFAVLVY